jgi:hypothetical protein
MPPIVRTKVVHMLMFFDSLRRINNLLRQISSSELKKTCQRSTTIGELTRPRVGYMRSRQRYMSDPEQNLARLRTSYKKEPRHPPTSSELRYKRLNTLAALVNRVERILYYIDHAILVGRS